MYEQFANEVVGSSRITFSDIDKIACKVIGGGH